MILRASPLSERRRELNRKQTISSNPGASTRKIFCLGLFLCAALLGEPTLGQAQGIITTVAGNGVGGFSGDGGLATTASLNFPAGVAVDGSGNLFIADTFNQRIRQVDVTGIITTVAGNGVQGFSGDGGPATSARLSFPAGVAMDGFGNVFIADQSNHRIRQVAPAP